MDYDEKERTVTGYETEGYRKTYPENIVAWVHLKQDNWERGTVKDVIVKNRKLKYYMAEYVARVIDNIHKALYPRGVIDKLYLSRKKEE